MIFSEKGVARLLTKCRFDSVIFELGNDTFINARAVATRAGVSGAILQSVQLDGTEQQAFDTPDGFVGITTKIYVRFSVGGI